MTEIWHINKIDLNKVHYLSGPMAGYEDNNFPAFTKAAEELRDAGLRIVAPHELKPSQKDPTDQDYLAHDFAVMTKLCNSIILLRGWPQSTGARAELEIAMTLKWPVYFYHDFTLYNMNRPGVN